MGLTVPCTEALREVERTRNNLTRFWNLIYAVATAFTILTILTVIALLFGTDPQTLVAGLAAIATGGGLFWVNSRKNDAAAEHKSAKAAIRKDCRKEVAETLGGEGLPEDLIRILAE